MKYKFNQQERGFITSFSRPRTKMYLILLKISGSFTWCFELYARYHEHYIEFSFYRFFPNEYIIKFQLSWTKLEQKQRSMSSFEIQGKDVLLFSLKLIGVRVRLYLSLFMPVVRQKTEKKKETQFRIVSFSLTASVCRTLGAGRTDILPES